MFDNARMLDLIERTLDADPTCSVCGAPTDVRDHDGRLWLECSSAPTEAAQRPHRPSRGGAAAASTAADRRPARGSRRLTCGDARVRLVRYPRIRDHPAAPGRSSARRGGRGARPGRGGGTPRGARQGGRPRQRAVPRRGRPRDLRRRVRPAFPRAGRARDGVPGPDDARVADAAGRWHPDRHVRRGPPLAPDAVALECVQPRRAAGVRHAGPPRARPAAGPRDRRRSCATSPSSRSMASRSASTTSAAGSSRAPPAATARPART